MRQPYQHLPHDAWDQITSFLDPESVVALGATDRHLRAAVGHQLADCRTRFLREAMAVAHFMPVVTIVENPNADGDSDSTDSDHAARARYCRRVTVMVSVRAQVLRVTDLTTDDIVRALDLSGRMPSLVDVLFARRPRGKRVTAATVLLQINVPCMDIRMELVGQHIVAAVRGAVPPFQEPQCAHLTLWPRYYDTTAHQLHTRSPQCFAQM